ncbi:type II toxin-antitoxin system VapC family toxin [Aquidulcibacter sp.]|uniref:type II toxin-antitoxin system VapC family toxin n=1 Tax=Aquidulcibacter sp. TaxID=2052990 RepID=UPI0028A95070|nr:type II toxin-antitoxin system VapC family toxin [Aquidulcibacter sp.]
MKALILDCSLAMAWCFEDEASPEADAVLDRVRDGGAIVPALWYWEVGNVMTMAQSRGRLNESECAIRLALLAALPIKTDDVGVAKAWHETLSLAKSHGISVYDAAYLELALRQGGELATKDKALDAVANKLGIETLP